MSHLGYTGIHLSYCTRRQEDKRVYEDDAACVFLKALDPTGSSLLMSPKSSESAGGAHS